MKTEFSKSMQLALSKNLFKIKKSSPEILIATGIISMITGTVFACKATLDAKMVVNDAKDDIEDIKALAERHPEECPEEEKTKSMYRVYVKTGLELSKLYAPAAMCTAVSIASFVGSHGILKERNVALTAAYATIEKSFKEYRKRVAKQFGDKTEYNIAHGIEEKEVVTENIDENGKKKKVKEKVEVYSGNPNDYSPYAKCFDETNPQWEKSAEYNQYFLTCQQAKFSKQLELEGYVFLNDVYKALGFEPTKAGQVVGWVYDKDNPIGDNYVDFGIYELNNRKAMDFINGSERSIILDFNVDGNIWDLM